MAEKLSLRTDANGNIYVYVEDTAGASLAFGADSSNGVIALNTSSSPNTQPAESTANMTIDPATNGDILFRPHGTGKTEFVTGNVQITQKSLYMPATNTAGDEGIIFTNTIGIGYQRTIAFPDDFNIYIGKGVGGVGTWPNVVGLGYNVIIGAEGAFNIVANPSLHNIGIGQGTFQDFTGGSLNIAIGRLTLSSIVSGANNIALGSSAGSALSGSNSNNVCIANIGVSGDSGVIRIGTNATQTTTYITGIDGVNVGSVARVVTENSDQLGTAIITAGTGISVVPGANTITINSVGGGTTWTVIAADQTAAVNNGYFCNKAGTLALALPAASAVGDTIRVVNINTTTGTQFTQAAGQQIFFAGSSTTLGATGTLTSSAVGDSITLVCRTANLEWWATSIVGNWTNV